MTSNAYISSFSEGLRPYIARIKDVIADGVLIPKSPYPAYIANNWYKYHDSWADGWKEAYKSRIEHFCEVVGSNVATEEIIDLDCDNVSI
ncbi:hypothetical protein L484_010071 [Morus notabilis]|uniref:Uncharacterized protein n=1 Tax=Morus notabilis TaxID=981085 RepID=W9REJ8_9ROSA|nr:hypothetical protein L484_010071 [Morus notabilis]